MSFSPILTVPRAESAARAGAHGLTPKRCDRGSILTGLVAAMNPLRSIVVLGVLASVAVSAADQAPVVHKPRKRLGAEPSREIDHAGGKSVVGNVQTIEKQFLNLFQSHVATSYNQLTARLSDEPALRARYEVRMTLNTETNESMEIKIEGELSERRRLLLREAIVQACKAVVCPAELRQKYGKVLDFSFDLVTNYRAGAR